MYDSVIGTDNRQVDKNAWGCLCNGHGQEPQGLIHVPRAQLRLKKLGGD